MESTRKSKIESTRKSNYPAIYEDEDWAVYVEMFNDFPFLHCRVDNWSVSRLKRFRLIFDAIKKKVATYGFRYLYCYEETEKVGRFAELFGFKPTSRMAFTDDGKTRRVMICRL